LHFLAVAAREEETAAEPGKSGINDDETDESGTTPSLPLLDSVALVLLLATFNGNDDELAGIGEEAGAIFPLNGSVFVA